MKTSARRSSVADHRRALKRLASELERRPLDFVPERSVECLSQFLGGYGIFGPPVWRDLSGFERWLRGHLPYPEDTGARWWRFIKLNSQDSYDSYELFFRLYSQYFRRI